MRSPHVIGRRTFLRRIAATSIGALVADRILADPHIPLFSTGTDFRPVRVRGKIHNGGSGIRGAVVSDGRSVVATGADGTYELLSDSSRPFIFLSTPAGFGTPVSATGTAAFHYVMKPDNAGEMTASWHLTPLAGPDGNHTFLLLADPQTQDEEEMTQMHNETVPDVRGLLTGLTGEVFGVTCGDIMFDRLEFFPRYEEAVRKMGIPFYQVLGNHDVEVLAQSDEASALTFMRYFGPNYYSFNRGNVHYVVLDDVFWHGGGYLGYLGQDQLDWLKQDLSFVEKGRTVVVFMHIPAYSSQNDRENNKTTNNRIVVMNRELLYRLLDPYKAHIIVGHMHETEHPVEQGVSIHVCGAVCGAWWTGPICGDGTPNGYGVFDVRDDEIRWRYKSTGQPVTHQIRVYDRGIDPAFPSSIVANVWDADDSWKVAWFENGERRGLMRRTRGFDPLARKIHLGKSLPAKRPWVEPYVTDHLYYAEPESAESTITIEATDRWGRVYREPGR